jgi:hypothetical protein
MEKAGLGQVYQCMMTGHENDQIVSARCSGLKRMKSLATQVNCTIVRALRTRLKLHCVMYNRVLVPISVTQQRAMASLSRSLVLSTTEGPPALLTVSRAQ